MITENDTSFTLKNGIVLIGRLIVTALAGLALFALLPAVHTFFSANQEQCYDDVPTHTVIIEREIPKPKPEAIKPQEIRQTTEMSGKRSSNSNNMKFMPDLGVGEGSGVAVEAGNNANIILDEGQADEAPIPVRQSPFTYPRAAKNAGIEGIIEIKYIITREGDVDAIQIIDTPHASFRDPVIETLSKWKFQPARMNGVPVAIRAHQTITFTLDN